MNLTKDYLHSLFEYRDGDLFWKVKPSRPVKIGDKAGAFGAGDYLQVGINNKQYKLHRIIFVMHHGYLPEYIDHIDTNRTNNRIENLRACNRQENSHNSKTPVSNTSGMKHVRWRKQRQKWEVKLRMNKKSIYFGSYHDLELAELVAIEARNKYHGDFANHGKFKELP
jgi:hypothetical protein